MSYDLNTVNLIGRLTRDPEGGQTQNGKTYCNFSIASNAGEAVSFFDITAWEKTADATLNYMKKGSMVAVSGRLVQDRFNDKDGNARSKIKISASSVQFIGGKQSSEDGGSFGQPPANDVIPF